MDLQLKGKTALVTGASMGIGRAIATGLAAEGVRLCIAARRTELLGQLAREIVAAGGTQPHIVTIDLMQDGAAQRLGQQALSALGKVEILINCAGGSRPTAIDSADEKWVEGMTLNFVRPRQLAHAVLPDMIKHRWGRIINITGKSEPEGISVANSAKAGIHAWAKGLSREVGKYGITVNSIPPGRIESEQAKVNHPAEKRAALNKEIPVGRFGEPEELAFVAVMLASPLASYVTGAVVPVDGGRRLYAF
jgi:3-oxoacyl-[acyl-carrier protein] reductase